MSFFGRAPTSILRTALWAAFLVFLCGQVALAQGDLGRPAVPPDFLDPIRRLDGDTLRVCINTEGVLAGFEADLARRIGEALLLDVEIVEVAGLRAPPILDYRFPVNEGELYILLSNRCPMMMGFLLSESRVVDWLTISRPYVEMGFVFAVKEEDPASTLAEIPPGARIGTRQSSSADLSFVTYNSALPEASRWRRIPYPNHLFLLERLLEEELDAILIWEAGLRSALAQGMFAGIRTIGAAPMSLPTQRFGAVFLQSDAFMRQAVDAAIALLAADGSVENLLQEHGLPGTSPR